MPGEIAMPDQTIGAAQIRTRVDAVGAAPVTALVSRKTGMMYVRRAFAPIFEVPVTIDQPNRPLGAHVYVARKTEAGDEDKSDAAMPSRFNIAVLRSSAGWSSGSRISVSLNMGAIL